MPKVKVYDISGNVVEEMELDMNIFAVDVNEAAMHMLVKNYLANQRQGTHSTKVKSEVSGGGKKPYRQKGTGRARQGSTRSAQWVGGGIIFGPKPRDYSFKVPKKLRRLALKSSLSSKVIDEDIIVLDKLELNEVKTKNMANMLKKLEIDDTALIVVSEKNENNEKVVLSARNIEGVSTAYVNTLNVYDILRHTKFVITKEALSKVSEVYA